MDLYASTAVELPSDIDMEALNKQFDATLYWDTETICKMQASGNNLVETLAATKILFICRSRRSCWKREVVDFLLHDKVIRDIGFACAMPKSVEHCILRSLLLFGELSSARDPGLRSSSLLRDLISGRDLGFGIPKLSVKQRGEAIDAAFAFLRSPSRDGSPQWKSLFQSTFEDDDGDKTMLMEFFGPKCTYFEREEDIRVRKDVQRSTSRVDSLLPAVRCFPQPCKGLGDYFLEALESDEDLAPAVAKALFCQRKNELPKVSLAGLLWWLFRESIGLIDVHARNIINLLNFEWMGTMCPKDTKIPPLANEIFVIPNSGEYGKSVNNIVYYWLVMLSVDSYDYLFPERSDYTELWEVLGCNCWSPAFVAYVICESRFARISDLGLRPSVMASIKSMLNDLISDSALQKFDEEDMLVYGYLANICHRVSVYFAPAVTIAIWKELYGHKVYTTHGTLNASRVFYQARLHAHFHDGSDAWMDPFYHLTPPEVRYFAGNSCDPNMMKLLGPMDPRDMDMDGVASESDVKKRLVVYEFGQPEIVAASMTDKNTSTEIKMYDAALKPYVLSGAVPSGAVPSGARREKRERDDDDDDDGAPSVHEYLRQKLGGEEPSEYFLNSETQLDVEPLTLPADQYWRQSCDDDSSSDVDVDVDDSQSLL